MLLLPKFSNFYDPHDFVALVLNAILQTLGFSSKGLGVLLEQFENILYII